MSDKICQNRCPSGWHDARPERRERSHDVACGITCVVTGHINHSYAAYVK
jgi:hypothetical protein